MALFLEGTITTVPLVLIILLCLTLIKREPWIFALAFICGIILDTMTLRPFGLTSIFYLLFLYFVLLYDRKYEIASFPFVFFSSFFGSLLYVVIFERNILFFQALTGSIFAVLLYFLYKRVRLIRLKKYIW